MAFRKPCDRGLRPADARALALFLQVGLARGNAVHRQRQPPRRRERLRAFIDEALGDQLVGDHAAQIVGRLRLHARGNFLGEQFEQKIGHQLQRSARFGMHPGFAAGFRQFAHAHDVALPLGHRDHAARVEQVEDVARLDALVVGRQRHQMRLALAVLPAGIEIFLAGLLRHPELLEQHRRCRRCSKLCREYSCSACRNTSP